MAAAVKTSPPHSSASSASSASSPEPTTMAQQTQFPTPRRKGGRKPVYATQEERKMRNRAAQAAFRERRTEYIKHLEATIKHQEESLSSLQQSSRNAADEVLMLRYKNSLLERILLEKGINVAAELKAFAQYDDRPQSAVPQPISRPIPSQQQQATLQQQHMHRPMIAQPQQQQKRPSINPSPESLFIKTSPIMPPSSRNNSPSIAIPTPPDASAYQIPQSVVTTPTAPSEFQHPGIPMQNFYPSPYQAHMEELGKLPRQEYDAELLESTEDDTQSGLENQSTTADGVGSEMMGGMLRGSPLQQHGIYNNNNVRLIDPSFESMFNMEPAPPSSMGGLTDVFMKQFNSPFGFTTSNLR